MTNVRQFTRPHILGVGGRYSDKNNDFSSQRSVLKSLKRIKNNFYLYIRAPEIVLECHLSTIYVVSANFQYFHGY